MRAGLPSCMESAIPYPTALTSALMDIWYTAEPATVGDELDATPLVKGTYDKVGCFN